MPEPGEFTISQCAHCTRRIRNDGYGWFIINTRLFSCAYGRRHHPFLDVPTTYTLSSSDYMLERWLDA